MSGSWCSRPFGSFVRPARALLFVLTATAVIGTFAYIHQLETPPAVNNGNLFKSLAVVVKFEFLERTVLDIPKVAFNP